MDNQLAKDRQGLGVNRRGNALLCRAYGESTVPIAEIVRNADELRAVLVEHWFGDSNDEELESVLQTFDGHNFWDNGESHDLVFEFEIGEFRFSDIYSAHSRSS